MLMRKTVLYYIKLPFRDLRSLEISEYIVLALAAILLPFDWQLSLWILPLLLVNTLARIVSERRIGNPSLSKTSRWALWLMVAYFLYQFVSMLYTSNKEEGWDMLVRRLPILAYTLCALAVNTAYLNRNRLRTLMYAFTASLVVKFFVRFVIMLTVNHKFFICSLFDPVHHTYMAMYLMLALGFLYSEWFYHRKEMSKGMLWVLFVVALILVYYLFLVNSRTGTAGLIALVLAVVAHWTFRLKQWKQGICLFIVALVVGTGIHFALPECGRRLTQTFSEMREGDTSDARYLIFESSMKAIGENGAFGVGIGDKSEVLAEKYEETGNEHAVDAQYNSHNIYLDAMLTTGIPGLVLLLAVLVVPAFMAWRRRDFIVMSLLFTFAFSGLFEALLNRQMGIVFLGLFWMVMMSCGEEEVLSVENPTNKGRQS